MNNNEIIHHDYKKTAGDHLLDLVKAIVRDPEIRHEKLGDFAKKSKWIPKKKPSIPLDYQIKFLDKSKPLSLSSPFILPAGANKYGDQLPEFANLGLGGLTVGTATKVARLGNPYRPRIRMLSKDRSIQNSMGLNNPGIEPLSLAVDKELVRCQKAGMTLGLSISESPGLDSEEEKIQDMLFSFRKAYNSADYVEINVSCPNTGHDRIDTQLSYLEKLFEQIINIRKSLPVRKAVYAKISPDMPEKQMMAVLDILVKSGINGLILFNTFPGSKAKFLQLQEPEIQKVTQDGQLGGLSGRPLYTNTFRAVEFIKNKYPEMSIIASGGIDHGAKAWDLLRAGADAIQSYSVIAYRWNAFHRMKNELAASMVAEGFKSMEEWTEAKGNI